MGLALYFIVAFFVLLAVAQGKNYYQVKTVKNYFKSRQLNYILVCNDAQSTKELTATIDKAKYDPIEIINIASREITAINFKLLEKTVRKAGVMKYPCLLSIEGDQIKGRYFGLPEEKK